MKFICLILAGGMALSQTTRYPGAIDSDNSLFIVSDNVQTSLNTAMATGDTTAVVASAAGFVPNMVATICDTTTSTGKCTAWEHMLVTAAAGNVLTVTRGFAGTSARAHSSGRLVSVLIDSAHQKVLKDSVVAIETALGPNLVNIGSSSGVSPSTYVFLPYSCNSSSVCAAGGPSGMNLIAGNNSLTMTPVPNGVNGSDTNHYFYVSGGTGTAEPCLITGGSGTSNQPSGQIIMNCPGTHSGAWTIQSASGGLREAMIGGLPNGGTLNVRSGLYTIYAPVTIGNGIRMQCDPGARLQMAANSTTTLGNLGMLGNAGLAISDIVVDGCNIDGNKANQSTIPATSAACPNALLQFGSSPGLTSGGNRIVLKNNYIHGYSGNGSNNGAPLCLLVISGNGNQITGNRFDTSDGTGGGALTTGPNVIMKDNQLYGSPNKPTDCAFTINSATAANDIIADNISIGAPICVEGAVNYLVTGNMINGSYDFLISLMGVGENGTVSNNTLLNTPAGFSAIQGFAPWPTTLTIANNHITRAAGAPPDPGSIGLGGVYQPTWNIQAEGLTAWTTTSQHLLSCTGTPTSSATLYITLVPLGTCTNTNQGAGNMPTPPSGIYRIARNLSVTAGSNAINNTSITLMQGAGATTLTCTILAGTNNCSSTTAALISPSGLLSMRIVTGAGETGLNGIYVVWEM